MSVVRWLWNKLDNSIVRNLGRRVEWFSKGKVVKTKGVFEFPRPSVQVFGIDSPDQMKIELDYNLAMKTGIPEAYSDVLIEPPKESIVRTYADDKTETYEEWRVINRYREDHRYRGPGRLVLVCEKHAVSKTVSK